MVCVYFLSISLDCLLMVSSAVVFVFRRSAFGRNERDTVFLPLIEELQRHFFPSKPTLPIVAANGIRVLCPGGGTMRLPFELAMRGFQVAANESSALMLMSAKFVLQTTKHEAHRILSSSASPSDTSFPQFTIHPFIHSRCDWMRRSDQSAAVLIPDIDTVAVALPCPLSIVEGSFETLYAEAHERWDAVVTCFFIDTGVDIVAYVDRIATCLRDGGLWLNVGPLAYHHSRDRFSPSIDLCYDELLTVIRSRSLEVTMEREIDATYNQHPQSMSTVVYKCRLFAAVKKKRRSEIGLTTGPSMNDT
jgi:carnosine N-methyltransferase